MTFDNPPTATPPSRALRIGIVITVIATAVAVTALVLILLGGDPPAVGGASPSPTLQPAPEASPSPTAEPTPTPTPQPTPQTELTDGLSHLNYGARATVATDRLRFRYLPSTGVEAEGVLTAGQELLILSGPISADGHEWFEVERTNPDRNEMSVGWVAAVPSPADTQPDDAWLIRIDPVTCPPDAVDTPMLARLTSYAIVNCHVQVSNVQGLTDTCYEGPYSPLAYEPGWAAFACIYLRDREATWSLPVFFPPEAEDKRPERGDLVTLTGVLGVDTSTYGACTVTTTERGISDEFLATQQQIFAAECPAKFVVSDVTIDGHITMPPMY